MIDFKELSNTDDTWELFARDFLKERGFFIESPPDRGPDAGKDMLVTERLKGNFNKYQFRWLVSCKHFANSGRSVSESDEPNILERVSSFKADGFIGFYSTIASSGLNGRLKALREEQSIRDYSILDHKAIENLLITAGYSHLLMRYFPISYKTVKPLHLILDEYKPLLCKACDKDILMSLFESDHSANIVYVLKWDKEKNVDIIYDVYCCCKTCDSQFKSSYVSAGFMSTWADISDLIIPIEFLRHLFATMNRIRDGKDIYKDEAFEKHKVILINIAQKVLRATTDSERKRFKDLLSFY